MMLQTALAWGLAKTNTLRGSSGEVLNPLLTENYAAQEFLDGTSPSIRTWGRVGATVNEAKDPGYEFSKSWNGLMHPNDHIRLFSAAYGIVTASAEGTAYKYTWAEDTVGDPLPVIVLGRYSTASTSYGLIEQCYINNIGFASDIGGSLETSIGFYGTKRTAKVATPSISIPDMDTRFRTTNATAYQTILSFTPTGGSADDFWARLQSFNITSPRAINDTGTTGGSYPNKGIPDPSPMGTESYNFVTKDAGGTLVPLLKEVAYTQGNAAGTLQASWAAAITGAMTITVLGGLTVADVTKKYTISWTGNGTIYGSYSQAGGLFTGQIVPDNWWARYIIGDPASVAQPT